MLLVEDDEQVRQMAQSALEEMGCHVLAAPDGETALGELEAGREISLLFADCMMPGRLDGPALALEARRRIPGLPVLFTSGIRGRVDCVGSDRRNVVFLPKPYTAEQLNKSMRKLMRMGLS